MAIEKQSATWLHVEGKIKGCMISDRKRLESFETSADQRILLIGRISLAKELMKLAAK